MPDEPPAPADFVCPLIRVRHPHDGVAGHIVNFRQALGNVVGGQ